MFFLVRCYHRYKICLSEFVIERKPEFGGNVSFANFELLEASFANEVNFNNLFYLSTEQSFVIFHLNKAFFNNVLSLNRKFICHMFLSNFLFVLLIIIDGLYP